ncbi:hypothetical protein DSM112329_04757 [Paraconexibacter sp. AEG42_29]|uniref:Uncharacterized protein n=1 Tax=Paraconexibacter sp. AEG42_29 TaxID=2997339 RepID=A0AAU7B1X8_9ACTN
MTSSSFSWLDFDEPARQRMREIVELLREEGSIDELGLGRIRDAFSDRLFPGTSVLWRRARYLLFVTWIYESIEREGFRQNDAERAARALQRKLRDAILSSDDHTGLIGLRRADPAAPPDVILWAALRQWGLRGAGAGTLRQYRSSLSRRPRHAVEGDPQIASVWNPQVPKAPREFPEDASFALTQPEARFLHDLVVSEDADPDSDGDDARRRDSMLADLLRVEDLDDVNAPWQHQLSDSASDELREALWMSGCFSDTMHGATLLYARRLAELREDDEQLEAADAEIVGWANRATDAGRLQELARWATDLPAFFAVVETRRRTSPAERAFVKNWSTLALRDPTAVARSRDAVRLVEDREAHSKQGKARLTAPRDRDRGDGGAIPGPLTYRWGNALQLVKDIRTGLEA